MHDFAQLKGDALVLCLVLYNATSKMKWNCVIVKFVSNILKLQQISLMQSLNAFTSDLMRLHSTAYDWTSWFEGHTRILESLKTFDKNKWALWIRAQLIVFVHLLVKGHRDKYLIRPGNWKHTNGMMSSNGTICLTFQGLQK